ncbi:effector-binding domain-containing protein [Angulomicrobium tetraedrale]|uniref:Effector-binding domain-containing protein n=1 Tax=Ancylobacter tetraedralis TaxID=217068 RepID=A0A839Z2L6_9HYPH|nr:GyrI-like domain-containing protein [Ancylobacter tetraedralis]MBB3770954.1 effector-binding domain-containing protein [Ancylobacter tetraedralis]
MPARALLQRLLLSLAFLCAAGPLVPGPLALKPARAQDATPPAAAPATPAPATPAPATPAPADPSSPDNPLDEDDMIAPPVVDPKGVETQAVAPVIEDPLKRPDGFGEEAVLKPVPVLIKKAHSSWDEGFTTIVATLKQIDAEMARLKLTPVGASLVIYTATDDNGFDFEAAVPFEGVTTQKPQDGVELSASPAGKALRFTHRGPYDAMDPTYEQIANLLDAKDLEAQDLYVEEYRSDPRTTSQDDMVIDIWVPLK